MLDARLSNPRPAKCHRTTLLGALAPVSLRNLHRHWHSVPAARTCRSGWAIDLRLGRYVDRLAIFVCSGRAEDEQARSRGIIVIQSARWEPGGGTPGSDVAFSHDGTDGASATVLNLMVQAVKQRSEVAEPLSWIRLP
jgi:hypothetical protein